MRRFLLFCAMCLTGCDWLEPEPVYIERLIRAELTTPCAGPVKGDASEGGFAELALGWKATSRCNADKLEGIGMIAGQPAD